MLVAFAVAISIVLRHQQPLEDKDQQQPLQQVRTQAGVQRQRSQKSNTRHDV
jgi:hypothetical protein